MSTYLYLECLDHVPPLSSEDESGQHLSDLPQIRADIAEREDIIRRYKDGWDPGDDFRRHTARFLRAHPACRLGIFDEYGRDYPTIEPISEPEHRSAAAEVLTAHVLLWARAGAEAACADPTCTLEPIAGVILIEDLREAQAAHQEDVLRRAGLLVEGR